MAIGDAHRAVQDEGVTVGHDTDRDLDLAANEGVEAGLAAFDEHVLAIRDVELPHRGRQQDDAGFDVEDEP